MDVFWLNVIANIVLFGFIGLIAWGITWKAYFGPRSRAFRTGASEVEIFFGAGRLVLWNKGETYVFLKNKVVQGRGDPNGGLRRVYPSLGMEAIGPIPQRAELVDWEDFRIMTRDAQRLTVNLAILWNVLDPEAYALRIASEVHREGLTQRGTIHGAAVKWLKAFTESAARIYISRLGVLQVISPTIYEALERVLEVQPPTHPGPDGGSNRPVTVIPSGLPAELSDDPFQRAMESVRKNVAEKSKDYGITIERLEVRGVTLEESLQQKLDEFVRVSFDPDIAVNRGEAQRRFLSKLADVVGTETVGANMLLKNFQGSNFSLLPQFLSPILGAVTEKTGEALSNLQKQAQLKVPPGKSLPDDSPSG